MKKIKLSWYKKLWDNFWLWRFWDNLAKDNDELAKHIVKQYGFVGFMSLGFDD